MIFYITLNEDANYESESEKIKVILKKLKYDYDMLGQYISREFVTLVIDIKNKIPDTDVLTIQSNIKDTCDILELGTYMKYYYTIKPGYKIKTVNDRVREKLNDEGYEYKIYNSHSENGIFYIGLEINNFNPFDDKQIEGLKKIINNVEGISELMKY